MNILQYFAVAGLSAIKVVPGVGLAIGFGFNPFETFLAIVVGGMAGVLVYSFFGVKIRAWNKLRRRRKPTYGEKVRKNIRKARRIHRIWRRFGILGIAFLTPPILSPPIGTLIAVGFGETQQRIILFMGISMIVWGLLFSLLGKGILTLIP